MATEAVTVPADGAAVTCQHTYPGTATRFEGWFEDRMQRRVSFSVVLASPKPRPQAPKDVQVWRDGGAWNEVRVLWLPIAGYDDYSVRVFKNGALIKSLNTGGRPPNPYGYFQAYVAPEASPTRGQVYAYDVSVKGADAWSTRITHQWAG
ncbi:hypothetical protein [Streptomyces olivoreticuli]|uniref:hypothetical protein n=1 Tax=Streptomyces olivoreticuli TaxID=68246 RepID=UPI000E225108|nr:hypothetical protein [Streptomyces olivoreticuli]